MKLVNKLLNKVGVDKALHLAVGALINALIYPFGKEMTIVGIFVVFILSCVKELLDSFEEGNGCDWLDVLWSVLGAGFMCVYLHVIDAVILAA